MTLDLLLMQRLVDDLNVGICVLDKNNNIVVFNRKAGEQLQQDNESRIGSSILRCHPERAELGVMKMINDLKSGDLEKYEGWVHFIGRYFYEYIYPLRDESGNHVATVMELHDAAERAEYLKMTEDWKPPPEHGRGESSPRIPFPKKFKEAS
ncbi:MAG: PAS domain-containing protein [Candidatus Thorarchaeota archaeon]